MESSEERYDPTQRGKIRGEHWHRYLAVLPLAENRDVLDIASGEGYGSFALAGVARSVLGVDIDAEVVAHASAKYQHSSLRFAEGACDTIPAADNSFDLIVSFETLEHHDAHDTMLREFRRVLRPSGIAILSSPNRSRYTRREENPFHVRELDRDEFQALILRHFSHASFFGQTSWLVSLLYPDSGESTGGWDRVGPHGERSLPASEYAIAVCSDVPMSEISPLARSLWLDAGDDGLEAILESYRHLEAEYLAVLAARDSTTERLISLEAAHRLLEEDFYKMEAEARRLDEERHKLDSYLASVEKESALRADHIRRLEGLHSTHAEGR